MAEEKEIKDRDAHNRERIAETLQKNSLLIFGILIVVALGWGGSFGYGFYQDHLDKEARLEFYRIENRINNVEKELIEAQAAKADKSEKNKNALPVAPEKTPESFEKNYRILAEELDALIKDHAGKRSALVSALYLADLYTEHGLDEKAMQLLDTVETGKVGDAVVVGLVRTRLAGLQSSSGQCSQAVSTYEDLESKAGYEFLLPQLLLRKVACLIELGKKIEAQAEIDRLKAEFESTEAGRMANIYERLLHLKTKDSE